MLQLTEYILFTQPTGFVYILSLQDLFTSSAYRICLHPQPTGFVYILSLQDALYSQL